MADDPYAIVHCGDVERDGELAAPLGPNGERCGRAPDHPMPHTAATKDHSGTVRWPAGIELPMDRLGKKVLDADDW